MRGDILKGLSNRVLCDGAIPPHSFNLKGIHMFWTESTHWHTLYAEGSVVGVLARVYKPDQHPTWDVDIFNPPGSRATFLQLDAALTLDEVKLVVQTLVGSQA